MVRWEVLRLEADGRRLLKGGWKGDKEDWEGVVELEVEGNGLFCEFWSGNGKSGELCRL